MAHTKTTKDINAIDKTERLTVSVPEAGRLIGLARNAAYAAVACGQIPSVRIGRRIFVPRVALERMLGNAGAVNRE